jgi:hypothetical protein
LRADWTCPRTWKPESDEASLAVPMIALSPCSIVQCLLFRTRNSRHTYSTLLHALGTTPAVQKELLRHADIQTTLNIYIQAVSAEKRKAASKVVSALWKCKARRVVRVGTFRKRSVRG